MKTFLIVYTRNDSPSGDKFSNETIEAGGRAEALIRVKEQLGDEIVIMNIIPLD